eukprot:3429564-Pyramimonas_sp.AAC.1
MSLTCVCPACDLVTTDQGAVRTRSASMSRESGDPTGGAVKADQTPVHGGYRNHTHTHLDHEDGVGKRSSPNTYMASLVTTESILAACETDIDALTDQIFSRWTNQIQEARVYPHGGPISADEQMHRPISVAHDHMGIHLMAGDLVKTSHHWRITGDSLLSPILYGRHMSVPSPNSPYFLTAFPAAGGSLVSDYLYIRVSLSLLLRLVVVMFDGTHQPGCCDMGHTSLVVVMFDGTQQLECRHRLKPRSRLSASQWQSIGREHTSNIRWKIRNAVR